VRKVIQLRGFLVQHYLIVHDDDVHIIDGGFIGGISRIERALTEMGKSFSNVRSIILSHGHLDHILNIAQLQELTQSKVYAPQADHDYMAGQHRHHGLSRVCGWLEKAGRSILPYRTPQIDHWFEEGDEIMDLKIISLPGHTKGHSGFLLEEEKLLLANDLFAHLFRRPSIPPRIFNDKHEQAKESIRKAAKLELDGIYLNHSRQMTPRETLLALIDLADHL